MSDDTRDDMRTTSEKLLADSDELAALERRKLEPDTSAAELEQLSIDAADLTRDMAQTARIQKRLASATNRSN